MIKRNRTWKVRSLPGYSLASRCTTDRLHVSLRTVTFCHGVLRSARFITAHYVPHFRRERRGRFLNCQKICHGVHGYPGVLRLPFPFPCVASRLFRFAQGCLNRGRRDHWEHGVNAVLCTTPLYVYYDEDPLNEKRGLKFLNCKWTLFLEVSLSTSLLVRCHQENMSVKCIPP